MSTYEVRKFDGLILLAWREMVAGLDISPEKKVSFLDYSIDEIRDYLLSCNKRDYDSFCEYFSKQCESSDNQAHLNFYNQCFSRFLNNESICVDSSRKSYDVVSPVSSTELSQGFSKELDYETAMYDRSSKKRSDNAKRTRRNGF